MTWTQTTLSLKDANNVTQTVIAYTDGSNYSFAHPLLDNTGAIISPATSALQTAGNVSLATIATNTTGAATAANQATANTSLATIATNSGTMSTSALQTAANTLLNEIEATLSGTLTVGGTVAVSACALPSGAATSANQSAANTSLASIVSNTTGVATAANQATANTALAAIQTAVTGATPAGSNVIGGVTMADGASVTLGLKADTAVTNPANSGSLIALVKGLLTGINNLLTSIVLAASTNTIGAVASGVNVITGNTLTRPANTTAYAFGQLIANTTSSSITVPTIAAARGVNVPTAAVRCRLQKNNTNTTNAIFRVHFWSSAPTVSTGDGTTFTPTFANYCGSFDVTCNLTGSDYAVGIGTPTNGPFMAFLPASGTQNLYYLIEARAAYTPASGEVFTPYLEIQ